MIVPVEITLNLIKNAMHANGWDKSKFLVDGFPRNEDNINGWNQHMTAHTDVIGIIYIKCSEVRSGQSGNHDTKNPEKRGDKRSCR